MARKRFLYYLKKDSAHYYVVVNGAVQITTTPTPLGSGHEPIQWTDTDIQYKRDPKYAGIFRSFVVPATFIGDSATILRHVKYTEGIEGKCSLEIHRLRNDSDLYDLFYSGDIDFSLCSDERFTLKATLKDSGLSALLLAYDSTPFQIPIEDSDAKRVLMDGIILQTTYALGTITPSLITSGSSNFTNQHITPSSGHNIAFSLAWDTYALPQEGDIATGAAQSTTAQDMNGSSGYYGTNGSAPNANFVFKAARSGDITVNLYQPFEYAAALPPNTDIIASFVAAHWSNATGAVVKTATLWTDPAGRLVGYSGGPNNGPTRSYRYNPATGSTTFTGVAKDDKIFVFCQITGIFGAGVTGWSGGSFDLYFYDPEITNDAISIKTTTRLDPSVVKCYTLFQLWQKLIEKITGGSPYSAASNLLSDPSIVLADSRPASVFVTCGDALRGLNTDVNGNPSAPVIKTTLSDFAQMLASVYAGGIGIEGTVARAEQSSYFFDNTTVIADLGEVKDLKIDVATEYIFNQYKGGYQRQTYDTVNGKDEFNTEQIYSAPVTRIKNTLDRQSPYRADMYGIEFTRYNLAGKKTTDSESDNDIFIMETDGMNASGEYLLARRQNLPGSSATGILQPTTAFNISLTPKRNLLRNASFISSAFHLLSGSLTFQTSDKNQGLQSKLTSGTGLVIENADRQLPLATPLLLPILFTFPTGLPHDMAALIEANPNGRINFKARNPKTDALVNAGGFIKVAGVRPADNAAYTYTLIAAPDIDMSTLIH